MPTPRDQSRSFFTALKTLTLRTLAGLAMLTIFLLCAFATMRIAIHGREVTVPALAGMSDTDAALAAKKLGLNLSVENRFYAGTVPANHILSQSPLPGASVRRGGELRVTESLGAQQVPVPDVTGQDEHPATLMLKRLQLDLGSVAHIPAPGPTGTILAQSPAPNVAGLDGPRVAILVADDEPSPNSIAYVMPSIVGLTVAAANQHLGTAGLHVFIPTPSDEPAPDATTPDPSLTLPTLNTPPSATAPAPDPAIPPDVPQPAILPTSVITSQFPLPGRRVTRADNIHVTVTTPSDTTPTTP